MTDLRERSVEAVLKASASWSMELSAGEAAELVDAVTDVLLAPTEKTMLAVSLYRRGSRIVWDEDQRSTSAAFAAQRAQVRGGKG